MSTVTIYEDGVAVEVDAADPRVPVVVPPGPNTFADISDRQCFQQLAVLGKVTNDEALAAVKTGTMPQVVLDGITKLPAAQQFPAQMLVCGATTFRRTHPMTPTFLSFFGLSAADGDALWAAAILL